ncbi:MAG: hypothetical protein SGI72_14205 [Planctomycetota bacterium]|nr:hypothetical protein [Planctomycetota bacterium]
MHSLTHALLTFALLGTVSASAQVPSYTVEFLGADTAASALNELGVAVGSMNLPGDVRCAAIALPGQSFTPLPLPAGYLSSSAYDVNDAGLVVGVVSTSTVPATSAHAAAWRPTPSGYVVEVLGEPTGDLYSYATGVNNLGDIVGSSGTVPWAYVTHAVLYATSGAVVLPGLSSEVADVNDRRKVLARNELYDLNTGAIDLIALPPGIWQGFGAAALNELDGMCGYIQGNSSTCPSFPMRYLPSSGWLTVGGCASTTSATAINDLGDVLTYVYFSAARVRLEGLGDFPIGQLIDPSQGGWLVQWYGASDINNRRQMLCAVREPTTLAIGAARLTTVEPVTLFCAGDGGGTACPCGNASASGADVGCLHSLGTGGRLRAIGTASVSGDALVLQASSLPNAPALYFQGTARANGGAGDVFGDGLRCVGGTIVRLGTQTAVAGVSGYPGFGDLPISIRGVNVAGAVRMYQAWYRDAAAFCTASTFNLTNGLELTWLP